MQLGGDDFVSEEAEKAQYNNAKGFQNIVPPQDSESSSDLLCTNNVSSLV
jgi:hypothetical protein